MQASPAGHSLLDEHSGAPPDVGLVVAVAGFGLLRLGQAATDTVPGVRLRLVQASIPQTLKWNPAARDGIFQRHLELSRGPGFERVTHVVWPETAGPSFLDRDASLFGWAARVDHADHAEWEVAFIERVRERRARVIRGEHGPRVGVGDDGVAADLGHEHDGILRRPLCRWTGRSDRRRR